MYEQQQRKDAEPGEAHGDQRRHQAGGGEREQSGVDPLAVIVFAPAAECTEPDPKSGDPEGPDEPPHQGSRRCIETRCCEEVQRGPLVSDHREVGRGVARREVGRVGAEPLRVAEGGEQHDPESDGEPARAPRLLGTTRRALEGEGSDHSEQGRGYEDGSEQEPRVEVHPDPRQQARKRNRSRGWRSRGSEEERMQTRRCEDGREFRAQLEHTVGGEYEEGSRAQSRDRSRRTRPTQNMPDHSQEHRDEGHVEDAECIQSRAVEDACQDCIEEPGRRRWRARGCE
jgi:hypothetical protein